MISFSSRENFLSFFSHYVLFLIFLLFTMLVGNSNSVTVSRIIDILYLLLNLWKNSNIILFNNILVVSIEDSANKQMVVISKKIFSILLGIWTPYQKLLAFLVENWMWPSRSTDCQNLWLNPTFSLPSGLQVYAKALSSLSTPPTSIPARAWKVNFLP